MDYSVLEQTLRYEFKNKTLLDQACCHSSYVNEQSDAGIQDNERFEFLGDAVLNLAVGQILMERFPHLNEGDLSRTRANFVNENQLAAIAKSVGLGDYLKLGKGEVLSSGNKKKSILADTFEAVIAAVYLDGGIEKAFDVITRQFADMLEQISANGVDHDFKTRLQEFIQMSRQSVPVYTVAEESGPDHNKTFVVQLKVSGQIFSGNGKSKKAAEQNAARKAYEALCPADSAAVSHVARKH